MMHMTVRVTVSLPDDLHAQLLGVAAASNVSASSVIRVVLSDFLPRMTGIIEFLGDEPPTQETVDAVDRWGHELETFLADAPPPLRGIGGDVENQTADDS